MLTLSFNKDANKRRQVTAAKLRARVQHWYEQATSEEIEQGKQWYLDANKFCETIAQELGFSLDGVAHCVAILSPQQSWEGNKRNAVLMATVLSESITIFASAKQKRQALDSLLNGYRIPETAIKTHSFADNIASPDSLKVTVDRHAVNIALNEHKAKEHVLTAYRYRMIEKAYQDVAKNIGLMPYQLQAITWLTYKRVVSR